MINHIFHNYLYFIHKWFLNDLILVLPQNLVLIDSLYGTSFDPNSGNISNKSLIDISIIERINNWMHLINLVKCGKLNCLISCWLDFVIISQIYL